MARKKTETDKYILLHPKDYMTLIEDHITLNALKIAGVETMPIYKSVRSILKNERVEIHIKPIEKNYR
ncbi:hypothetical protein D0T57_15230 [Dysgonomonas sp. 511]|nr:hypothetical protein [Dysgonomonas sp. 511]